MTQWLRLCTPKARSEGSVSGLGTKTPYAAWCGKKKKKKIKPHIMLGKQNRIPMHVITWFPLIVASDITVAHVTTGGPKAV